MDDQTDATLDGTPRSAHSAALRECPRCNINGLIGYSFSRVKYWARCGCGEIFFEQCYTEADAIAAWNRRDGEATRVAEAIVYVVKVVEDYEGYEIAGIFATYEGAVKCGDEEAQRHNQEYQKPKYKNSRYNRVVTDTGGVWWGRNGGSIDIEKYEVQP